MYSHIENLLEGPYIEMFARQQRNGWDQYGNEIKQVVEHYVIIAFGFVI